MGVFEKIKKLLIENWQLVVALILLFFLMSQIQVPVR